MTLISDIFGSKMQTPTSSTDATIDPGSQTPTATHALVIYNTIDSAWDTPGTNYLHIEPWFNSLIVELKAYLDGLNPSTVGIVISDARSTLATANGSTYSASQYTITILGQPVASAIQDSDDVTLTT